MTSPSTVLFCSQSASTIGGVESWLDQLCAGLDPSRWRPVVGLVRGCSAHNPERFKAAHPTLETVEIDGRGMPQEGRVRAVTRAVRRINPAIFIPLVVADAHEAAARLRSSSARTRYLLTLHGNTAPQLVDAQTMIAFADFAVGPGLLASELMRQMGMPEDRLRTISNGACEPAVLRRERQAGAPLRLGYVGRLTQTDKRAGDLVPLTRALAELGESFELTIAGDGDQRTALVEALAGFPVRFLGSQTSDALYRDVYPNLDAMLLFSESEAFGIAAVEAMLHGVVPVTSDFVGRASEAIVEHEATGLVFPVGDTAAAAAHVFRLAREPATLARLSRSAFERVDGRYSWSRCVTAWDEALQATVSLPPRRAPSAWPRTPIPSHGTLDRMGLSPALVDGLRRFRRSVVGVPRSMHGGEEWPWTHETAAQEELDAMRAFRKQLDRAPERSVG